jgi:hypothetical protein
MIETASRIEIALRSDDRCRALHFGVSQLSTPELLRLQREIKQPKRIVVDEVNYESRDGLWCPLALGLAVPDVVDRELPGRRLSNRQAKNLIRSIGRERRGGEFSLNPVRRVAGKFFRRRRLSDLSDLVDHMLVERNGMNLSACDHPGTGNAAR